MAKLAMVLVVVAASLLSACSGGDDGGASTELRATSGQSSFDMAEEPASVSESSDSSGQRDSSLEFASAKELEMSNGGGGFSGSTHALQTARRQVISTAEITLSVSVVQTAIDQTQSAVVGMGGFVERLSSSGGPRRQRANMTIRVPQAQFFSAISRIEALGVVQSRNLGAEDVSAQFIDLEARLRSSLGEEESLLGLLERTQSVAEVLAIERELFRVRAEIERTQGQLNFIERRVDLATIDLTLVPIDDQVASPPSASFIIGVDDVGASVSGTKGMVASVDGLVDRVFFSVDSDREDADLSVRVHAKDFERVVDFLEAQGDVRSKTLTESSGLTSNNASPLGRPEAAIEIVFLGGGSSGGGVGSILKVIGIVLGALILGVVALLLIRLGLQNLPLFSSDGDGRFA